MADILTQIQDGLDVLLGQMHYILAYTNSMAPPAPIEGQPLLSSFAEQLHQQQQQTQSQHQTQTQTTATNSNPSLLNSDQTQTETQQGPHSQQPPPIPTPEEFTAELRSTSKDLVVKTRQLELLIAHLPGIGTSSKQQVDRMSELERELEEVEKERVEAVHERDALLEGLEGSLVGVGCLR